MYLHVDLCAGLGGWTAPTRAADNWRVVGVDVEPLDGADVVGDVRQLPLTACEPDLLTMSPPCDEFSRWWMPWCECPDPSLELVEACLDAVDALEPRYWVMENVIGLHAYWRPAVAWSGPWFVWGHFPPVDLPDGLPTKAQHSGEQPARRAKIPYDLADAFRQAVETWS